MGYRKIGGQSKIRIKTKEKEAKGGGGGGTGQEVVVAAQSSCKGYRV
jgi:hypothetical protein